LDSPNDEVCPFVFGKWGKYEGGDRRLDVLEYLNVAAAICFDPCRLLRSLIQK
jgi:hypothetical protein